MIPLCKVGDILERERNAGAIPNAIKQALEAMRTSELSALITSKDFDATWGTPVTLAMFDYDEKNIVGFALLVYNGSSRFVPKEAQSSIGIVGWMPMENGRSGKLSRDYCGDHCPVDIFGGILDYIKQHLKGSSEYCWSFFDDLMLGFGGYRTADKAPNGEAISVLKL